MNKWTSIHFVLSASLQVFFFHNSSHIKWSRIGQHQRKSMKHAMNIDCNDVSREAFTS